MEDPPPNPLGFCRFEADWIADLVDRTAVTALPSPHSSQRSGRIPALPYPLPEQCEYNAPGDLG